MHLHNNRSLPQKVLIIIEGQPSYQAGLNRGFPRIDDRRNAALTRRVLILKRVEENFKCFGNISLNSNMLEPCQAGVKKRARPG